MTGAAGNSEAAGAGAGVAGTVAAAGRSRAGAVGLQGGIVGAVAAADGVGSSGEVADGHLSDVDLLSCLLLVFMNNCTTSRLLTLLVPTYSATYSVSLYSDVLVPTTTVGPGY